MSQDSLPSTYSNNFTWRDVLGTENVSASVSFFPLIIVYSYTVIIVVLCLLSYLVALALSHATETFGIQASVAPPLTSLRQSMN